MYSHVDVADAEDEVLVRLLEDSVVVVVVISELCDDELCDVVDDTADELEDGAGGAHPLSMIV